MLLEEVYSDPNYMEREHHTIYTRGHVLDRPDWCLTCQEYLEQRRRDILLEKISLGILGTVLIVPALILALLFIGQLINKLVSLFI